MYTSFILYNILYVYFIIYRTFTDQYTFGKKTKFMKSKIIKLSLVCLAATMIFTSCKKENIAKDLKVSVLKEWNVDLSTKYQVPAVSCNHETGSVKLQLFSDNSLSYKIEVKDVEMGDELVAAHIHEGNVLENGMIVLGFDPMFSGGKAMGVITNLRSTFADSLLNDMNELYFNVHSKKHPKGLVRGQLNAMIVLADDVILKGDNQMPKVNTTAQGLALLRLTSDKKLYSNVTVKNLEGWDELLYAHIHKGDTGVNGPIIVNLCMSAAEFGIIKISPLSDENYMIIKKDYNYVNVHSKAYPKGIVRGQINN